MRYRRPAHRCRDLCPGDAAQVSGCAAVGDGDADEAVQVGRFLQACLDAAGMASTGNEQPVEDRSVDEGREDESGLDWIHDGPSIPRWRTGPYPPLVLPRACAPAWPPCPRT